MGLLGSARQRRQRVRVGPRGIALLAVAGVVAGLTWGGTDHNPTVRASEAALSAGPPMTLSDPGSSFRAAGFACAQGSLRSSGSTAQGKVMAELIRSYNTECGARLGDYGGGGSGKGITDFLTHQTDFAGSDTALVDQQAQQASAQRCGGEPVVNLPLVIGPIALVYHLPGVDQLVLNPAALTGIFTGKISRWNDPVLVQLNPDVALPDLAIIPVHRAEDSGTTDNFTRYLAAAGEWPFEPGKAWVAPGGVGAQGSDGVAKEVAMSVGAVGYVEWGFARQANLATAELDNGAGPVALTAETAARAAEAATVTGTPPDLSLQLDYTTSAAETYPLVLLTYQVVCWDGNGDQGELLRSFLGFVATEGQTRLTMLDAAPLPSPIREQVIATIRAIK